MSHPSPTILSIETDSSRDYLNSRIHESSLKLQISERIKHPFLSFINSKKQALLFVSDRLSTDPSRVLFYIGLRRIEWVFQDSNAYHHFEIHFDHRSVLFNGAPIPTEQGSFLASMMRLLSLKLIQSQWKVYAKITSSTSSLSPHVRSDIESFFHLSACPISLETFQKIKPIPLKILSRLSCMMVQLSKDAVSDTLTQSSPILSATLAYIARITIELLPKDCSELSIHYQPLQENLKSNHSYSLNISNHSLTFFYSTQLRTIELNMIYDPLSCSINNKLATTQGLNWFMTFLEKIVQDIKIGAAHSYTVKHS